MQAFSNANIKDKLCGGCDCTGFAPHLTYDFDGAAETIDFEDLTVYPTGDFRKAVHIAIHDKHGGKVVVELTQGDGTATGSTADLDTSDGIDILATIVTNEGCLSDGHATLVNATGAGKLGSWDKDNDSLTVGATTSES